MGTKMHAIKGKSMFGHDVMPVDVLPEISFDETNLPEIKSWKVGSKYNLTIEVEMISLGKDSYDKQGELRARFKVSKVGVEDYKDAEKQGRMGK